MEPERWDLAKQIYFDLAAIPARERRGALDARCAGDAELHAEVAALLAHADVPDGFLGRPAFPAAMEAARELGLAPDDPAGQPVGSMLGPYRVESLIGSGGMGAVYLASRADGQFEQQVAIKLVKRGLDTSEVLDRFRRERQLLAGLNHPNIARLLDGGIAEDGCPFIVMEHIEGEPIDRYCRERDLSVEGRLRLFCSVCTAVHYAHQNLVVHRDIKPGNLLVTQDGTPKLLDFGIARVLQPNTNGHPEVTIAERRLLTPGFASPEQVLGRTVSTASDVYSLGVVLYHMLAGEAPYRFTTGTDEEIRRLVCESAPPPPGATIRRTGSGGGAPSRELARRLRGDLDNIVLMAMRKEPERRYASAEQFAADIQRHLGGHPVIARPDTFSYRTGKLLRRNAIAASAAAALFVALAAGAVGIAWQARSVEIQRDRAVEAQTLAEQTRDFLQSILLSANAFSGAGYDVTVREVLADAADRAHAELAGQPVVLADILGTIGAALTSLGLYDQAEPLLRESLALARTLPPESAYLSLRFNDLATMLHATGGLEEAEQLTRESLELATDTAGRTSEEAALALNNLGAILRAQNRLDEAEVVLREAMAIRVQLRGPDHLDVAQSMNNIAGMLRAKGDLAGAEELLRESLRIREKELGDRHPLVAQSISNLAVIVHSQGDLDRAEPLYERAIEVQRVALGEQHPDLASVLFSLGMLHQTRGDLERAEPLLRQACEIRREAYSETDARRVRAELELARCLSEMMRHDEAIQLARAALDALSGDPSLETMRAATARLLAEIYEAAGMPEEAAKLR